MGTTDIMKAFMFLGDLDKNETLASRVAYKEKIVFSTMRAEIPGWEKPANWDELTLEVRMERLEKLQKIEL